MSAVAALTSNEIVMYWVYNYWVYNSSETHWHRKSYFCSI